MLRNARIVQILSVLVWTLLALNFLAGTASATEQQSCRYIGEVQSVSDTVQGSITVEIIEGEVVGEGSAEVCDAVGSQMTVVVSNNSEIEDHSVTIGDLVVLQFSRTLPTE